MARVLVVDDEPDVRELFNITLKMAGHVTETAKDGVEAVERLQTDIPDLILLDLMMPRLDGFGLLTHIRQNMDSKPVRVLVATAKVLEEADNQKLNSWPVVGVLNKGELDISAMVMIVSTALSKDPAKPSAPAEAAQAEPASAEKPAESPAPAAAAEKKAESAEPKKEEAAPTAPAGAAETDKKPEPAASKPEPSLQVPTTPAPSIPGNQGKPQPPASSEPEKPKDDGLMVAPPHSLGKAPAAVPADQNGGSQKPEEKKSD